jgi:hypothetical protein
MVVVFLLDRKRSIGSRLLRISRLRSVRSVGRRRWVGRLRLRSVGRLLLVHQSDGIRLGNFLVTVSRVRRIQDFVFLSLALGWELDLGEGDLGQLEASLGFRSTILAFRCLRQLG